MAARGGVNVVATWERVRCAAAPRPPEPSAAAAAAAAAARAAADGVATNGSCAARDGAARVGVAAAEPSAAAVPRAAGERGSASMPAALPWPWPAVAATARAGDGSACARCAGVRVPAPAAAPSSPSASVSAVGERPWKSTGGRATPCGVDTTGLDRRTTRGPALLHHQQSRGSVQQRMGGGVVSKAKARHTRDRRDTVVVKLKQRGCAQRCWIGKQLNGRCAMCGPSPQRCPCTHIPVVLHRTWACPVCGMHTHSR